MTVILGQSNKLVEGQIHEKNLFKVSTKDYLFKMMTGYMHAQRLNIETNLSIAINFSKLNIGWGFRYIPSALSTQ